jgi:NAD(P)-dependent dehydrogenase (short-subunit alcohol dehydrogenase family)
MDLELKGKTALVTGGSRGIGKTIARQLALEGADVAICARNEGPLQATAAELRGETGRRILPVVADTSKEESIQQMVKQVLEEFGHIDILVNNAARAGGSVSEDLASVPLDVMRSDFETKVLGYLLCARAVAPSMKQRGWGRIINISGGAAAAAGSLTTGTRNIAVVSHSKSLAQQLGPYGITVNTIHPGAVRTEAWAPRIEAEARRRSLAAEEVEREWAQRNTMRRVVDPQEIAYVVAFLASPKAVAVTGEVIATSSSAGSAVYP